MQLDSESWSCRQCGGGFIGGKPDDLICEPCAAGSGPKDAINAMFDRIHASPEPPDSETREVPGYDH